MRVETYDTFEGREQYRPVMTLEEAEAMMFDAEDMGLCLACGEEAYDVEPDARRYECGACGEHKVYGLPELMMMGLVGLEEEEER